MALLAFLSMMAPHAFGLISAIPPEVILQRSVPVVAGRITRIHESRRPSPSDAVVFKEKERSEGMPTKPARILFIGNSYTNRNDLPGLLTRLAEQAGYTLETDRVIANGMSLKAHWNKGEAAAKIREGAWDHVALQEQSNLPWKSPARFHESVRLFDPLIRESGAKTVLYETWARQDQPEHQASITGAYRTISDEIRAIVVPVGEAWERVLRDHPDLSLHDADQSHPSLAGSYLTACVFYATLFGETPASLPAEGIKLESRTVQALQEAAEQATAGLTATPGVGR